MAGKVARLRQLTSSGQQVQPADPEKVDVEKGHGLMRSRIQEARGGRGAEGVETLEGLRTEGVSKASQLSLSQTGGPYHH